MHVDHQLAAHADSGVKGTLDRLYGLLKLDPEEDVVRAVSDLLEAAAEDGPVAAVDAVKVAKALWREYLRIDEWAGKWTIEQEHAARTAVRCCATALGVYEQFVALDKERELPALKAAGITGSSETGA